MTHWKNTTACLQHKPQTGCHKTVVETTWQVLTNGDFWELRYQQFSILFKISNNDSAFGRHCAL